MDKKKLGMRPSYRACFLCKILMRAGARRIIEIDGELRNVCDDCKNKLETDVFTKSRRC